MTAPWGSRWKIIFDPHMHHFAFPKGGDRSLINDLDRVLRDFKADSVIIP